MASEIWNTVHGTFTQCDGRSVPDFKGATEVELLKRNGDFLKLNVGYCSENIQFLYGPDSRYVAMPDDYIGWRPACSTPSTEPAPVPAERPQSPDGFTPTDGPEPPRHETHDETDPGVLFMASLLADQLKPRAPAGINTIAPQTRVGGMHWGA